MILFEQNRERFGATRHVDRREDFRREMPIFRIARAINDARFPQSNVDFMRRVQLAVRPVHLPFEDFSARSNWRRIRANVPQRGGNWQRHGRAELGSRAECGRFSISSSHFV